MNWESLNGRLDAAVCAQLQQRGFAVVDDALDRTWAEALRQELVQLSAGASLASGSLALAVGDEAQVQGQAQTPPKPACRMQPNKVQFQTAQGPVQITKPHIFEADMHDPQLHQPAAGLPEFTAIFFGADALVHHLNNSIAELRLVTGCKGRTVKLQYNSGFGGSFPWHYDNPSRPNNRLVTCLVYLNPDWRKGHGGELQLMPFLQKEETIEPLFNRMVLFMSDRVLHRVLPATHERFCFTVWLDSTHANTDEDVFLKEKHLHESQLSLLMHSPLQRTLSRAVYTEEYEQSLRECFGPDSSGLRLSLALHNAHLSALLKSPRLPEFVQLLRSHRQDSLIDRKETPHS